MTSHSSILAWKFAWTEEPGGLQSMGSQRVRHDQCGPLNILYYYNSESDRCSVMSNSFQSHELQLTRLLCPWNSPGKKAGVGCHSLFQGIFLTKGLTPGLLHCGQILYCLSHQGSTTEVADSKITTISFPFLYTQAISPLRGGIYSSIPLNLGQLLTPFTINQIITAVRLYASQSEVRCLAAFLVGLLKLLGKSVTS